MAVWLPSVPVVVGTTSVAVPCRRSNGNCSRVDHRPGFAVITLRRPAMLLRFESEAKSDRRAVMPAARVIPFYSRELTSITYYLKRYPVEAGQARLLD